MAAPLHLAVLAGHTDTALALATYKHRTGKRGRHDAWADAEEKEKEEKAEKEEGVWPPGSDPSPLHLACEVGAAMPGAS